VGWCQGLWNLLHRRVRCVLSRDRSLACPLLMSNDFNMVVICICRSTTQQRPKARLLLSRRRLGHSRPTLFRLHNIAWNRHERSLDIVPRTRPIDPPWWSRSRSLIPRPALASLSTRLLSLFIDLKDTEPFDQGVDTVALLEWVELCRWTARYTCSKLFSLVFMLPAKVRRGANLFLIAVAHY